MGIKGASNPVGMTGAVPTIDLHGEWQGQEPTLETRPQQLGSTLEPRSRKLSRGGPHLGKRVGFFLGVNEEVQRLVYGVTPRGIFYGKWWVSTSLNSATRAVAIESPSWKLFNYLAIPQNLTEWAITEINSTAVEPNSWLDVTTLAGPALMNTRIDPTFGVVDFKFVRSSQAWYFATRILANSNQGCEFVVTVFSPGPFGSKLFDSTIALVDQRLDCLKMLMEGRG